MSGKLVGEVVDWLRTPVAADLTPNERVILLVIAERASETNRKMWRHRTDDESLVDRLRGATGLDRYGLTHALARLGKRGLEVRVQIATDKAGRPVYARRGHSMEFVLPEFPASVHLPERVPGEAPIDPVDNPGDESEGAGERVPDGAPKDAKGCLQTHQRVPGEAPLIPPYPSTACPSKDSDGLSSSVAGVEGAPASPAPFEEEKFDQDEYRMAQQQLLDRPDCGAPFLAQVTAAEPSARHEVRIIHAARLAKGIPA